MAEYAVRSGSTAPNPLYTGNDATDTEALVFEDPIGTRVGGMTPAGLLRGLGLFPALPSGGLLAFGGSVKVARANYNFATQGGAQATIGLTGALGIPNGAIVIGGFISIPTTIPVGSGASISVGLNTTTDLLAADAISGAPWSTTGVKAIIPVFTAATAVVATAARDISIAISGANLTAGVFDIWVFYLA